MTAFEYIDELPFRHHDLRKHIKCSDVEFALKYRKEFVNFTNEAGIGIYLDKFTYLEPVVSKYAISILRGNVKNAGGHSNISEAFSIDILSKLFSVKHVILETDVVYDCVHCSMVDYIMEIPADSEILRVGVSVTRAFRPNKIRDYGAFTMDDAVMLLTKKLFGLVIAREGVVDKLSFYQSILHIWSPDQHTTNCIIRAMKYLDMTRFDIVGTLDIWITTCSDPCIFTNELNPITATKMFNKIYCAST